MKILYVVEKRTRDKSWSLDYQCDALFHGLISAGHEVLDTKYLWPLHEPLSDDMREYVYGNGFTLGGKIPSREGSDRSDESIRRNIREHYYDLVIFGSIWRCADYIDTVCEHYDRDSIVLIDGEDHSAVHPRYKDRGVYFKREQAYGCSEFPISFAVPEEMFSDDFVVEKEYDMAPLIPYEQDTYVYKSERAYYDMYAKARFAYTCKKASWDALRHYEIVAAHTLPVFTDVRLCPQNNLTTWPRDLQMRANALYLKWASGVRDVSAYNELLREFYEYGKSNLTTKRLADYVLSKTGAVSRPSIRVSPMSSAIPLGTYDCARELPHTAGGAYNEAVIVNSYGSALPRILLASGRFSRVYCVEDYSDGNSVYADVNVGELRSSLEETADTRIVPVYDSVENAIAKDEIPESPDVMFLVGCAKNNKLVDSIRASCNRCVELCGDGYHDARVQETVDGVYGIYKSQMTGYGWYVRDPERRLCVAVPVYRQLTPSDVAAVEQMLDVTKLRYDMFIVCPESFNTDMLPQCVRDNFSVLRFPSRYFLDVNTYSRLCTLKSFYARFSGYTHVLIYQTDGFMYRDDLFERWMKYDYVGAPWCWSCDKGCIPGYMDVGKVGNGGVSLRRISAMDRVIAGCGDRVEPEDMRIVTSVNSRAGELYVPSCVDALSFSVETLPRGADYRNMEVPCFTHRVGRNIRDWFLSKSRKHG